MKHRNSHLLVGYWSRLRKGQNAPDQTDIDPRSIKRILPYVFILDASDAARPLYRLAGTSHCDRYGIELRGTNFLCRWEAESRDTLVLLLKQALATSQPVCLSSFGSCEERGTVEIETVLAPLTFAGARPTRFIGFSHVLGDVTPLLGRVVAFERLVGSEFVRETVPMLPPDLSALPPARAIITPKSAHLRLVVANEKPAVAQCETDRTIKHLMEALEIVTVRAVS